MRQTAPGRDALRIIDAIGALSVAADMAVGLSAGHGIRGAYIGMRIAERLRLPADQRADLYYAGLLMDAGCTAWASQIAATVLGDEIAARRHLFFFCDPRDPRDLIKWLARYMAAGESLGTRVRHSLDFVVRGRAFMQEGLENTSEVAARLAHRLGCPAGAEEGLRFLFEQWDGSGPHRRRAAAIPIVSRIVFATLLVEVAHQIGGRDAALQLVRARRGKAFDPDVVDAIVALGRDDAFWRGLEQESIWPVVREMEPDSGERRLASDRVDDVACAFADFADLKSFYSAGHSRRVAALAERMAQALALPPLEVTAIRRAALLHDIGIVAVPSFVLHKPEGRWSDAERESVRLHPYYAERILSYVPAFAPLVPMVASHHEQPDGHGFFRGLAGDAIPIGASIIAAADRFDELTHAGPGRAAVENGEALQTIRDAAGGVFLPAAVEALACVAPASVPESLPETAVERGAKHDRPAGLTDREIDVLRLLAAGWSRRQIASALSVSEHTVRHHLEHIYAKIDVRTRVEATLFAIEHALIQ
jgi:HD-GYP domain-containing protein (c-di-GMP phosphodiesterase class II)/DNA-binding CsgD family transcriptional regulator